VAAPGVVIVAGLGSRVRVVVLVGVAAVAVGRVLIARRVDARVGALAPAAFAAHDCASVELLVVDDDFGSNETAELMGQKQQPFRFYTTGRGWGREWKPEAGGQDRRDEDAFAFEQAKQGKQTCFAGRSETFLACPEGIEIARAMNESNKQI